MPGRQPTPSGVSLVELISVLAIIILMAALIFPAAAAFSGTTARRGAVNVLLNAFEQARLAALETGQTVYVGFADADFPVAEMRYAAFLVFRETSDDERFSGAGDFAVLRKWTRLPRQMAFKRIARSLVPEAGGETFAGLSELLPAGVRDETFPCLAFTGTGSVLGGFNPLQLFLYEGSYENGRDRPRTPSSLFERISLSRYTGRARLEVTATQ